MTPAPRILLAAFFLILALGSEPPAAPAASPDILPFKDVTAGMRGTGRTVFSGSTIEEFSVEIIGSMENILPKKNLILARLEGGPLRDTGIMEGMSGSPVYINGKMIGAVAYSWGFAKEPICGITPIEEMIEITQRGLELRQGATMTGSLPGRAGSPAPVSLLHDPQKMSAFLRNEMMRLAPVAPAGTSLRPLPTTLAMGGFGQALPPEWLDTLRRMSLQPVLSGRPPAQDAQEAEAARAPLLPGAAFGATLVRGDLDMTAIGTVTWTSGDQVVGFGHPFLMLGPIAMPMTRAHVFGYFPSLMSSFKLAAPAGEIGAVTQDRFAGVAGLRGAKVRMVPIRVEMKGPGDQTRSWKFDLAPDPLLTPGLLNLSLLNLLSVEEKAAGDVSLRLTEGSRIQVDEGLDIKLDNLFAGSQSTLYAAGTVAFMTYLVMNNEERPSGIDGVNLRFEYEDARRTARIERIWLERYTARPGETVMLHADLQPFREAPFTVDLALKIPAEAPEGKVLLQVGDSLTVSRMESVGGGQTFVPRNLEHLVWLLNNIRSNQKVYASVIKPDNGAFIAGQRLPNLPPSIGALLLPARVDGNGGRRVRFRTLLEADAVTRYAVRGYQKTQMEIAR